MTIDAIKYGQLAVEGRGTNGKKHPAQKPIPRRTRMVSRNLFDAERTKAFQVAWSTAPNKMASMMSTGKTFPFRSVRMIVKYRHIRFPVNLSKTLNPRVETLTAEWY